MVAWVPGTPATRESAKTRLEELLAIRGRCASHGDWLVATLARKALPLASGRQEAVTHSAALPPTSTRFSVTVPELSAMRLPISSMVVARPAETKTLPPLALPLAVWQRLPTMGVVRRWPTPLPVGRRRRPPPVRVRFSTTSVLLKPSASKVPPVPPASTTGRAGSRLQAANPCHQTPERCGVAEARRASLRRRSEKVPMATRIF